METGLQGRRVLVTAASKGLGFAVARAMALEGARVVVSSSDDQRLEQAASVLAELGGEVHAIQADVSSATDCERLVAGSARLLGGLDVLINNCRGPVLGTVEQLTDTEWYAAFEMVLMSAVRLSRAALPLLRRDRGGSIVNLTSIAAHQPVHNLVLSNALRPAVVAVGKTLATEAAPKVRVNSILTGRFATDRIAEENQYRASQLGISAGEVEQRSTSAIPLRRYGRPDELAAAAIFLAGDCSSFITGSTLAVDGGEHVGLF